MALAIALLIGGLFAAGIYLLLRRSVVKLIIGLALLSHGANLFVFTAGGLTRGAPALVPFGAESPPQPHADPLAQALVLTALVIGLGIQAVAVVLIKLAWITLGTDDINAMTMAEEESA